jgi:uncharacterized membrane protein YraQ (UPF0718 family)
MPGADQLSGILGVQVPDFLLSFLAILLEGGPFLLLGSVFSGLVDLLLPIGLVQRWLPRSKWAGLPAGLAAGFVLPLCECSAIPIVSRLIRKGVPLPVAATYLLASPLLNPLTLLSTYLAFRSQRPLLMVGARVGTGVMVVFALGWWISRRRPEEILRPEVLTGAARAGENAVPLMEPNFPYPMLPRFFGVVIRDFLSVLPFLVFGAAFAAVFSTGFHRSAIEHLGQHVFWGPVMGTGLSQLLCLCSTTDAFVIAAFSSLSIPAKLAFLVAGPLFDFKLYWLYQSLFRRSFVCALWWRILSLTLFLTWLYGCL